MLPASKSTGIARFMSLAIIVIVMSLSRTSQTSAMEESADQQSPAKPTIVIVHGAWGGGHQWKPVANMLQKQYDRPVHRVTLTGQGERAHLASPDVNLSTHIQDVVNVIEFEELDSIILIGHSYGGAVISGVADAIPDKISQLIYLDSNVLEDGESYLTHMPDKAKKYTQRANEDGDGWLIPVDWDKATGDVPHQLSTLKSAIKLNNPKRLGIPTVYWQFADGKPPENDDRYLFFQRAKDLNWDAKVFSWNHNPHRDRPADLVAELMKVIKQ